MSGPYRVVTDEACRMFRVQGPGGLVGHGFVSYVQANQRADQLNSAYAAGLAASGREAELVKALKKCADRLERCIFHAGSDPECAALAVAEYRSLLTPTDDREYREAVEKLLEEGSS